MLASTNAASQASLLYPMLCEALEPIPKVVRPFKGRLLRLWVGEARLLRLRLAMTFLALHVYSRPQV